jgi:hypothetical protein
MAHVLVLSVVFFVAAFDVVVGLRLLFSPRPHLAHGGEGPWARAPPTALPGETAVVLRSLYRRMGAFSLHAGVVTAVWAAMAHDDRRGLTALLVTYAVTGPAFFATDRAYFRGTRYFVIKQALGALWTAALVVDLASPGPW